MVEAPTPAAHRKAVRPRRPVQDVADRLRARIFESPPETRLGSLGGLAIPALQAMMTERTPPNAQGELQGALGTLSSLTIILGPPLFALVFSRFSGANPILPQPGMPFLLSTLLAGSALLVLMRSKPGNVALQG